MTFAALPGIHLEWDEYDDMTDPFVQYNVYRRRSGLSAWTRIAVILAIATVEYTDYAVQHAVTYEYTVTVVADMSGVEIESDKDATPPSDSVTFTNAGRLYIHAVEDPTIYAEVKPRNIDIPSEQDIDYLPTWGGQAPIAQTGERQSRMVSGETVPIAPLTNQEAWTALRALQTAQRTLGTTLCLRSGYDGGDVMFCQLHHLQRSDVVGYSTARFGFTESRFSESV